MGYGAHETISMCLKSYVSNLNNRFESITYPSNVYYVQIPLFPSDRRANSGSEFVVANALAKWKKLEPNEINVSQCFSQKVVSRSCSVFNSLPSRSDFCCLLTKS